MGCSIVVLAVLVLPAGWGVAPRQRSLLDDPRQVLPAVSAEVRLDSTRTYQRISGWEATAWAGDDRAALAAYRDQLFDRAVHELGITRVRVEFRSGVENSRDFDLALLSGQIDRKAFRCLRYSTVNDDDNPFQVSPSGFHFANLDEKIEDIVLPLKERVEAAGSRLSINLHYVAFTGQMTEEGCPPGLRYHHDAPEEYAEVVLATTQHLREKYDLVPDLWSVILEPDNTQFWRGRQIGEAIVATGRRLVAAGFSPRFVAPSTTDMGRAATYFDDLVQVSGVLEYLEELSYHRYSGVSQDALEAIRARSVRYGVRTSMLERIGADHEDLHADLKVGNVSAWQQFVLAGPGPDDNTDDGSVYYIVRGSDPAYVTLGSRARLLRQYFRFIRPGAIRVDAASDRSELDPLAFVNPDGAHVVVMKATQSASFAIAGLPEGIYGITYTTRREHNIDQTDVHLGAGATLNGSIPDAGVVTVYRK